MWQVTFTPKAKKELKKLDKQEQRIIIKYLEQIISSGDAHNFGSALVGNFSGFWRYRVGKYRLICKLEKNQLIIEIISIGKRDKIYL